jgi:cytochrome c biogenesis protein CcdA
MTTSLVLAITGLALLDSVNPTLFIAQLYLLATPDPLRRVVSYIAGVVLVNLFGGLLLLAGVQALLVQFLAGLSDNVWYGAALLLGLALVGFGLWLRQAKAGHSATRQPRSLHPWHAFVFGVVVMLNEITTALPYFVAIERLGRANLSTGTNVVTLLLYNLCFSLPLIGFLFAYLALRQRFLAQLSRIEHAVQVWAFRIVKYGSILFGMLLVVDAAAYFVGGATLFSTVE